MGFVCGGSWGRIGGMSSEDTKSEMYSGSLLAERREPVYGLVSRRRWRRARRERAEARSSKLSDPVADPHIPKRGGKVALSARKENIVFSRVFSGAWRMLLLFYYHTRIQPM